MAGEEAVECENVSTVLALVATLLLLRDGSTGNATIVTRFRANPALPVKSQPINNGTRERDALTLGRDQHEYATGHPRDSDVRFRSWT